MREIKEIWNDDCTYILIDSADNIKLNLPFSINTGFMPMLNIGCGTQNMEGFINCDLYKYETVDCIFNAEGKWPFKDECVRSIYSSHLIEHLNNSLGFFDEALRCLHREGSMIIRIPHIQHTHSYADMTHKRLYPEQLFYWLQPDPLKWTHNLEYKNRKGGWRTKIIVHVLSKEFKWIRFLPFKFKRFIVNHFWNICLEMIVWMKPF